MKESTFKLCFVFLLTTLSITSKALPTSINKPFVIPELKEWKPQEGTYVPSEKTRVIYPKGNDELKQIANIFSEDYETMFGVRFAVSDEKAKAGDIVLGISPNKSLGEEGYQIKITDKVMVTSPEPIGNYWATKTLLQISEQSNNHELPKGEIVDFPDYKLRGLMLDCGRKYIPIDFLRDYVKLMAYYKMNTFHIHLNDNGFPYYFENDWNKTNAAFRLESDTYPGLAAQDGYYTKQEFIDLQKLAEKYFVEIIPEIDVPAHSLAFTHYKPEIGSQEYGMDHLDLFNPETYTFLDGLFKEYLEGDEPVFRGKKVHIGTDEYSNKKKEVVEKFRYFTDYYIRYIESFGKEACIWGSLTHAKGDTPVKSDNVLMYAWSNDYADPKSMMQGGYELVSIPDGLLYIVPQAGYYYDYLETEKLYKDWTPANINGNVFPEKDPNIRGGMFAVWNDHVGNGITTKDIHDRVMPALQTLAVKMWTGKNPSTSYEEFDSKRKLLSEAPGVNIAGKIGNSASLVFEEALLKPNTSTEKKEIGYNYTVTFDLDGADEDLNTILFSSPNALFYLSDPIKGMMSFSRDGYLNTFNYKVKGNEKIRVKICGDNKGVRFYVDDRLVDNLSPKKQWFNEGKNIMNYNSTLVFPLEKSGNFKSNVSNLKVYNYLVE